MAPTICSKVALRSAMSAIGSSFFVRCSTTTVAGPCAVGHPCQRPMNALGVLMTQSLSLCHGCRSFPNSFQPAFGFSIHLRGQRSMADRPEIFCEMLRVQRADDDGLHVWVRQGKPQQELRATLS